MASQGHPSLVGLLDPDAAAVADGGRLAIARVKVQPLGPLARLVICAAAGQ